MIEAITDPDPELTLSWYDMANGEIADICVPGTTSYVTNGHTWMIQKLWSNAQGVCTISGPNCIPAAVAEDPRGAASLQLACANPVGGTARFHIGLPAAGVVDLSIYDLAGRRVAVVLHGEAEAGSRTVDWRPEAASAAGASVYFARLHAAGHTLSRTVIVRR